MLTGLFQYLLALVLPFVALWWVGQWVFAIVNLLIIVASRGYAYPFMSLWGLLAMSSYRREQRNIRRISEAVVDAAIRNQLQDREV